MHNRTQILMKPSEPNTPEALESTNVPSVTELLRVQDSTEIYFRNLQAFEQCDSLDQDHIGDYISMINFLVISPKDMEILVENRILENWIHDNEAVSTVLHDISKLNDLSQNNFIFAGLV